MKNKRKIFYVQQFDVTHCCAGGQVEFPDSALTGLEVWHSLSDNGGANGSTINSITDLSGNARTGTATGSGRTLKIESGLPNLKGIELNGSDDKVTFTMNANLRTVCMLWKSLENEEGFGEYYGLITQQAASGINFLISGYAGVISNGMHRRLANINGATFNKDNYQLDYIRGTDFSGWSGDNNASKPDLGELHDYKVVFFETTADVSGITDWQWGQDRTSGASRALNGIICDGLVWSRVLTQVEKDGIVDYFRANRGYHNHYNGIYHVIIDGNSLMCGVGSTGGNSIGKLVRTNMGSDWHVTEYGIGSLQTDDMGARITNVISQMYRTGYQKQVYMPYEVTNHLTDLTVTKEVALQTYKDVCALARNIGYTILGTTVADREDAPALAKPNYHADIVWINNEIISYHAALNEEVVDFAADARLADANDVTYFTADKVHLNNTGYQVMADLIEVKLNLL
jgi:hypothetical protein